MPDILPVGVQDIMHSRKPGLREKQEIGNGSAASKRQTARGARPGRWCVRSAARLESLLDNLRFSIIASSIYVCLPYKTERMMMIGIVRRVSCFINFP
jgi:hypothetical protein